METFIKNKDKSLSINKTAYELGIPAYVTKQLCDLSILINDNSPCTNSHIARISKCSVDGIKKQIKINSKKIIKGDNEKNLLSYNEALKMFRGSHIKFITQILENKLQPISIDEVERISSYYFDKNDISKLNSKTYNQKRLK
ncbi:hypothetical protein [Rossellomorea arthrocnemi]|uniref:hypothetical protein n=1 Tax=Rossellomorea arthrocnemi TaxID=2769542 RepID=UPI001918796C|nr:hypothetical protein [Rossellomorea arthrocnemi]